MATMRSRPFLALALLATLLMSSSCYLRTVVGADGDVDQEQAAPGTEKVAVVDSAPEVESTEDLSLGPAPGVDTVIVFPKNKEKLIPVGEPSAILLGISNGGESDVSVTMIKATLNYPYDHRYYIQNFTAQEFENAVVPPGVQASFMYEFVPSSQLQPREFSLVSTVYYEVDGQPHSAVFYNGTIEIIEQSGVFSGETLFLSTLGIAIVTLVVMWLYQQFQRFTKNQRAIRVKKVETGTKSLDESNPWLQGTAVDMKRTKSIAQPRKSEKKKPQKPKEEEAKK